MACSSSTPQALKKYISPAILLKQTVSNSDDLILNVLKAITSLKTRAFT